MRQKITQNPEVIIVGGALGGLTLAARLGSLGVRVLCLEGKSKTDPRLDGRTTAIAAGPQRVLEECGVWSALSAGACPIHQILVRDQNAPVELVFNYKEAGDEPFGWLVANGDLRLRLEARCRDLRHCVTLIKEAEVITLALAPEQASVTLVDGRNFSAQLVVAADGRRSQCRELAGIETHGWNYGQTAIVCNVAHTTPHRNVAVEQFMPAGPLATLPLVDVKLKGQPKKLPQSSIVWTESTATADYLLGLTEADFTELLQEKTGDWLGEVKLSSLVMGYPLNLVHAHRYTARRFALISEAAHGIHPIAGQGLNLGMRDIADLATEIERAMQLGLDLGDPLLLRRYEKVRKRDNTTMAITTDLLVRLFSNANPALQLARRFGLSAVQQIPALRRFFMRQAMGKISN